MNIIVLCLAAACGIVASYVVFKAFRSIWAAILTPVLITGLAAASLPWGSETEETSRDQFAATRQNTAVEEPASPAPNPLPTVATLASLKEARPLEIPKDGYVGSEACVECHQGNHATWFASYHRSMTQLAKPEIILGNLESVRLSFEGHDYEVTREGDTFWVNAPDPEAPHDVSKRRVAPIVMTTGSHHMQVYWWTTGEDRTTALLPFAWIEETNEWIPRTASFLQPELNLEQEVGRWGQTCSMCHSTHRREMYLTNESWDTEVSEFGISCEACHGPGQPHIDYQRRLAASLDTDLGSSEVESETLSSDPIVNPESLDKVQSAQVCGQCHSVVQLRGDIEELRHLNLHGHKFRPGKDLDQTHHIVRREDMLEQANDFSHGVPGPQPETTFYKDGMIRVSGREYNGLTDSACYQRGEMTCLTCHQLHKSSSDDRSLKEWANDQLKPSAIGDESCLQCHSPTEYGTNHTHHAAGSSGSSCYNCHMPHTTYGLLKAIRSHTITSPNVEKDRRAGRPNACNLCHLDKTLEWTADSLQDWYGIEKPAFTADEKQVAASLLWLLKGDAAERALVAWSMGWEKAQAVSGTDWQIPFLAQLIDDPYLAIRFVARRSLRTMKGLNNLTVSLYGAQDARHAAISALAQYWYENQSRESSNRSELLFTPDGLDFERVQRLMSERDNTPVMLSE